MRASRVKKISIEAWSFASVFLCKIRYVKWPVGFVFTVFTWPTRNTNLKFQLPNYFKGNEKVFDESVSENFLVYSIIEKSYSTTELI